jgi:hypothetical protein
MLASLALAFAAPVSLEGHYVEQAYLQLAASGRALDWHPNRWVSELTLRDGKAIVALHDAPTLTCPYTHKTRGDVTQVQIACPAGPFVVTLRNERASTELPWGTVEMARSGQSARELEDAAHRALSSSVLAGVQGIWRRGEERLSLTKAQLGSFRLAPCELVGERTLCLRFPDYTHFVLHDGQFKPTTVYNDGGGPVGYARGIEPGAWWSRDVACTTPICAVTRTGTDGASLRWVPVDHTIRAELAGALEGGTLSVETGPGVSGVRVRLRLHTRGATTVGNDQVVGWGDLGVASDWVEVAAPFALPATLRPEPLTLDLTAIQTRVRACLPDSRADDTFRARAAAAVATCHGPNGHPCSTAVGAIELEIQPLAEDGVPPTPVIVLLERGLAC